jgi:hypothetical protein
MSEETIFIVDRIVAQPGSGETLFRRYVDEYAPVNEGRGLTLEHRWVSPPVWLEGGQSNTLTFVWSTKGAAGFWAAGAQARFDPSAGDWWQTIAPLLSSRSRSVMSEASDIASLTDV